MFVELFSIPAVLGCTAIGGAVGAGNARWEPVYPCGEPGSHGGERDDDGGRAAPARPPRIPEDRDAMFDPHTLLLLAALAAPADSPARAPSANDSVLASVVSPLVKPGDRLRVRTGFGVTEGLAGTIAPRGVQLRREQAEGWSRPYGEPIPWAHIEQLDRQSRHGSSAAKAGATFGALLGAATVMSVSAYATAYGGGTPSGSVLMAGVAGAFGGACLGGLVGGVVGSLLPSWRMVYERR